MSGGNLLEGPGKRLNLPADLFFSGYRRKIEEGAAQAFCQLSDAVNARRAAGDQKTCRSDPQEIVVVFTEGEMFVFRIALLTAQDADAPAVRAPVMELEDSAAGFGHKPGEVAVRIQSLVVS